MKVKRKKKVDGVATTFAPYKRRRVTAAGSNMKVEAERGAALATVHWSHVYNARMLPLFLTSLGSTRYHSSHSTSLLYPSVPLLMAADSSCPDHRCPLLALQHGVVMSR